MKIALYIEDGVEQIVLTPQGDVESALLRKLHDQTQQFEVYRGGFYNCQGGWIRQTTDRDSTIIVLRSDKP